MDEPLDSSGAEEAIERLAGNKQDPPVIQAALWFKERGFDVIPVKTGGKDPTSDRWESAIKNDPRVFLRNPGTQNYGLLPPPGVVILDVDGEVPTFLHRLGEELGHNLPTTMTNASPHGLHVMYRWPKDLPRPKGPWWGKVVARWNFEEGERAGRGYVVGPGSKLADGGEYRRWLKEDIADLPVEWAQSVLSWRTPKTSEPPEGLFEVGDHYVMPEVVEEGGRYEAVRDYSAHLYNRGFNKDERWAQVLMTLVPRFAVPKKPSDVRADFERSNAEMEERLGPPAALPSRDNVIPFRPPSVGGDGATDGESNHLHQEALAPFIETLRAREPVAYAIDRLVVMTGLNFVGGHPKSGKSLALLQMGASFVLGQPFLGQASHTGGLRVFWYVTQEGSYAEMLTRAERIDTALPGLATTGRYRISFLQPMKFVKDDWLRVSTTLRELESEYSMHGIPLHVWLCIDPMRDAMLGEWDENDAKDMAKVKEWCRWLLTHHPFLTLTLVHHLRKGARGDSGLDLSGSGATFGMADSVLLWKGHHEKGPLFEGDSKLLGTWTSTTRGDAELSGAWAFDPSGVLVPRAGKVVVASDPEADDDVIQYQASERGLLQVIEDAGRSGVTVREAADYIKRGDDWVRSVARRLQGKDKVLFIDSRYYVSGQSPSEAGGLLDTPDLPSNPLHSGELD